MQNFIHDILANSADKNTPEDIFNNSFLLQYLDKKTNSVEKSSKSRSSFANIYAIYVLTEDYIKKGFLDPSKTYANYDGLIFTEALNRTRELPFGAKIQNHALNNRCNDEFRKFFNTQTDQVPIIRDLVTKKYWINESLLKINVNKATINIAPICMEVIEKYIDLKRENFNNFFDDLMKLNTLVNTNPSAIIQYISDLLNPTSDARIFEIVSFVLIKYHYITQKVTYQMDNGAWHNSSLITYKVGRTNANDGGIDYLMKPIGRIFQVTEVLDFRKYFLDIDKLIHFPITFVVKQDITPEEAMKKIIIDAKKYYIDEKILKSYIDCFEEIITIPTLKKMLGGNIKNGFLNDMINELIVQTKVEYNID